MPSLARRAGARIKDFFGAPTVNPEYRPQEPEGLGLNLTDFSFDDKFLLRAGGVFGRTSGLILDDLVVSLGHLREDLGNISVPNKIPNKGIGISNPEQIFRILIRVMEVTHADVFNDEITKSAIEHAWDGLSGASLDESEVVEYINQTFLPDETSSSNSLVNPKKRELEIPIMRTDIFMGVLALDAIDRAIFYSSHEKLITNPLQTMAAWVIVHEMTDELV